MADSVAAAVTEAATSSSHGSEKNSTNESRVLENKSAYQNQRSDDKSAYQSKRSEKKSAYQSQRSGEKSTYQSQRLEEKSAYQSQRSEEKLSNESQRSGEKSANQSQRSEEKSANETTSEPLRSQNSVACETPLVTQEQGTGIVSSHTSTAEHSITQQTKRVKDPEISHLNVPSGLATTQVKVEASEAEVDPVTDAAVHVTSVLEFVERATQTDTVHLNVQQFSGTTIKQEMLEPETGRIQLQDELESTGKFATL